MFSKTRPCTYRRRSGNYYVSKLTGEIVHDLQAIRIEDESIDLKENTLTHLTEN